MSVLSNLAQTTVTTAESTGAGAFLLIWLLLWLGVLVVVIAAYWRIFTKAGKPGWASIVPFYNTFVLIEIAGKPTWWFLLLLLPFVNIVVWLFLAIEIAKAFGKDEVFGVVALWLFTPVGAAILGFGDASYHGTPAPEAQALPQAPQGPTPTA